MDFRTVGRDTHQSDDHGRLDRRSVLRCAVGCGAGLTVGAQQTAARASTGKDDSARLAPVGSTGDTSNGNTQDSLDSPGTVLVGGALIAVTILYVLFRPDGDTAPSPSSGDTVAWDNPKFTDNMETARTQLDAGAYQRAISAVQTAIQTAESARARAEQRGDDTETISRAVTAGRDLKEEILAERDSYESVVTSLEQLDEELTDLREQHDASTDAQSSGQDRETSDSRRHEALLARLDETVERLDRTEQTILEQEFDDLVVECNRLQEDATDLRDELLTNLARATSSPQVTVSAGDTAVTKRLSTDARSAPAVVYDIRVPRDESIAIRVTDTIPSVVETDDIIFSDGEGDDNWRVTDDSTIVFERDVEDTTSLSTAYEIQSTAVTDMSAYLTEPDLRDQP